MFTPLAPRKRGPSGFGARPCALHAAKLEGRRNREPSGRSAAGLFFKKRKNNPSTLRPPAPVSVVGGQGGQIMSQFSLFAPPVCSACASASCPGASDPGACLVVVAVAAHLAANAPARGDVGPVVLPVVVPVERAVLAAVAVRIASEVGAPLPSCPACGRRLPCSGVAAVAFLARVPARLAPPPLARARVGLWCPVCGRCVSPSQSPDVASRLRRWLA